MTWRSTSSIMRKSVESSLTSVESSPTSIESSSQLQLLHADNECKDPYSTYQVVTFDCKIGFVDIWWRSEKGEEIDISKTAGVSYGLREQVEHIIAR